MLGYHICLAHVRSASEQEEALFGIRHAGGLCGAAFGALAALRLYDIADC